MEWTLKSRRAPRAPRERPGLGLGLGLRLTEGGTTCYTDAVVGGPWDPGGGDLGDKNRKREREPAGNTYLGLGADARGLGWVKMPARFSVVHWYVLQPLVDQSPVQARGSPVSLGSGLDGNSWEEGTCLDPYAADCD